MNKYLFVDTETGGIGLDKSLLSIGLIWADEDLEVVGSKHFLLKPDDGIYNVTATALSINKINLIEHDKVAVPYKQAKTELYNLLDYLARNTDEKLIVVGKNIYFDLTHIWDKTISRGAWEHFCSYQTIDITAIWKFLELTKQVPKLPKTSLVDIATHYRVDTTEAHDAFGDCWIGLQCFRRMIDVGGT